ncbi:MAG: hypothetical protein ACREV9_14280 [Burkholderiales bacterium]
MDSASALFNFDTQTLDPAEQYTEKGKRPFTLPANAYFREAAKGGYDIHAYQMPYANFCDPRSGYSLEFVSLHDLFASYVLPSAGHSRSGTVVVESLKTGKRQETAMPHFASPGKPLAAHSR